MRSLDPLAVGELNDNGISVALDAGNLDIWADRNPFTRQMGGQTSDQFGIVTWEHRPDVEHRDPRAQPAMGLRHFDPDRTAADHDQMVRPYTVGENRFVRQVGSTRKPGNGWDGGIRAGRDDKAARADLDLADADRAGAGEPRLATQYPDPETLEPLDGIMWRDGGDDVLDTVRGGSEIGVGPSRENPERRAAPRQIGKAGGGKQRFRRDAAEVQAVAAHQPALDQHDRGTHLCRSGGNRQPCRAGSDDAEVGGERPRHAGFLPRQRL